ncbi:MAG: hypothetical protein M3R64_05480 [Pseudomonadota bacterium]|nr:hypothetical protein [Pseudomonadota bacterium]
MKISYVAATLFLLPGVAVAQNQVPSAVMQYSGSSLNNVTDSYSQTVRTRLGATATPTMQHQATTRALALREQVSLWTVQDGGTLSKDHRRDMLDEVRAIRSLMGDWR